MDVFKVHEQVIADYRAFTSGFVEVRDRRIKELIDQQFAEGVQWPDPWLSLNPSFASGGAVPELVEQGLLHAECARIFRRKNDRHDLGRDPIVLHQHQREAVETARTGKSYVLTTGTGSGKSLAYIVPVVDAVLRERDENGGQRRPGVKAIVVYPMNALANSQLGELEKFLQFGYTEGEQPVTYARYTGQESPDERRRILAEPPDILLTNYVMLELVLTRPDERKHLVRAARGLRFLALDELHTYRGRQGADVAMLIRRLREQCAGDDLQIIGTSATMSSEGNIAERQAVVARVATRLFGSDVTPQRVIGETLVRATPGREPDPGALRAAVDRAANGAVPIDHATLIMDPLAAWAETTFGLDTEPVTERLIRRAPTTVPSASAELAELTGAFCKPAPGSPIRSMDDPYSRFGSISSCPKATPSTSRSNRKPRATLPALTRSACLSVPAIRCCPWASAASVGRSTWWSPRSPATASRPSCPVVTRMPAAVTVSPAISTSAATCRGPTTRSPPAGCRTHGW